MAAPRGCDRAAPRQAPAARDRELPLHQIDAGDQLGDRMLDLQPRIHFHEVELLLGIHQELDGARADVADGARRGDGRLRHGRAHLRAQSRRRGLLDDLLMPALHRAVAIEQRDGLAVRIGKDLHLDVPRGRKVALEQQPVVAERGARQALRRFDRGRDFGGGMRPPACPCRRRPRSP